MQIGMDIGVRTTGYSKAFGHSPSHEKPTDSIFSMQNGGQVSSDDPIYWKDSVDALGHPCKDVCNPYDILDQYKEWKQSQPEIDVPNAGGWTAANMQFLQERYGDIDKLPVFKRLELIDVLQKMNIINCSENELESKLIPGETVIGQDGCHTIAIETAHGTILHLESGQTYKNRDEYWSHYNSFSEFEKRFWGDSPLNPLITLDDVLKWAESF